MKKTSGQTCGNCKKRMTKQCAEYKQSGKYPPDGDWCAAWKKKEGKSGYKN